MNTLKIVIIVDQICFQHVRKKIACIIVQYLQNFKMYTNLSFIISKECRRHSRFISIMKTRKDEAIIKFKEFSKHKF